MAASIDFASLIWENRDVTGESFQDADLSDHVIRNSRFSECDFRGARFDDVVTSRCTFTTCDFTGAHFNSSRHETTAFVNCRFVFASLFTAHFDGCKLMGSSFQDADLSGMTVAGGDWSYVFLQKQDLRRFNLRGPWGHARSPRSPERITSAASAR